jgi:hypothetical protein
MRPAQTYPTAATISITSGFYYQQRGGSTAGDYLTLYELLTTLIELTWGLMVAAVGYVCAGLMWSIFDERMLAAKTEGTHGWGLSYQDGYKYMALSIITGIGAWIGAVATGDSSTELLGFY